MLQRTRSTGADGQPLEFQLLEFPSTAALSDYMIDDRRLSLPGRHGRDIRGEGHDYGSVFMAMDSPRRAVRDPGEGRRHVSAFAGDLAAHGGDPGKTARTSSGMPAAFMAGVRGHLPDAQVTSGRFHITKDAVRSGRRGGPGGSWLPA